MSTSGLHMNTHILSWNKYMPSPPHIHHIYIQKKKANIHFIPLKTVMYHILTVWLKMGPIHNVTVPQGSGEMTWKVKVMNDLSFILRTHVKVERDN